MEAEPDREGMYGVVPLGGLVLFFVCFFFFLSKS